ncbi:hypothetical protein GY12_24485 [Micrococcus luteus]|nr:hypothetical protein GY12_24485 [Micrococcus luteus]
MEKVAETSFFGQGLSTAFVDLDHVSMFFHNSYLGLLVEGGWPFLAWWSAPTSGCACGPSPGRTARLPVPSKRPPSSSS